MALRPRKKSARRARFVRCSRCGGRVRRKYGHCKKCSKKLP